MARTKDSAIVAAQVSRETADQLKAQAARADRSVSSLIRRAIRDQLNASPPAGDGSMPGGGAAAASSGPARRGVGAQREGD